MIDLIHARAVSTTANNKASVTFLSAEHASTTSSSTLLRRYALHLLTDFDVDLEEFGDAAVYANAFAFVEFGFAVVGRNALLRT